MVREGTCVNEHKKLTRQQRYDKAHTTGLYLKLNNDTDRDLLERLEAVENKQGYIKALIRNDIKGESGRR